MTAGHGEPLGSRQHLAQPGGSRLPGGGHAEQSLWKGVITSNKEEGLEQPYGNRAAWTSEAAYRRTVRSSDKYLSCCYYVPNANLNVGECMSMGR